MVSLVGLNVPQSISRFPQEYRRMVVSEQMAQTQRCFVYIYIYTVYTFIWRSISTTPLEIVPSTLKPQLRAGHPCSNLPPRLRTISLDDFQHNHTTLGSKAFSQLPVSCMPIFHQSDTDCWSTDSISCGLVRLFHNTLTLSMWTSSCSFLRATC